MRVKERDSGGIWHISLSHCMLYYLWQVLLVVLIKWTICHPHSRQLTNALRTEGNMRPWMCHLRTSWRSLRQQETTFQEVNKLNNSQRLFALRWTHNKSLTPLQLDSVHSTDPVSITFVTQDVCLISLPSQTWAPHELFKHDFDVKHLVAFDNAGRLWCVH